MRGMMLLRAASRGDTVLYMCYYVYPDCMGIHFARLTSSRRGQARHIVGIGIMAGKGAVWVVVLIVPHGAEGYACSMKRAVQCLRKQRRATKGLSGVRCALAVKLQALAAPASTS